MARLTRTAALALCMAWASIITPQTADAANTPCSGKKGGVSHCYNGKFICKDGSMSQSKKTCRSED
jgi:hypothetical protein